MEELMSRVAALEQQVRILESADGEQWKQINDIRDRLPNWSVLLLTVGGGVIGFLLNWLLVCLK